MMGRQPLYQHKLFVIGFNLDKRIRKDYILRKVAEKIDLGRLGSDQAILLIFKQYPPNNRCFEALKGHFQRINWPRKEWTAPKAHSFLYFQ